jgi:hypothetical protein
MSSHGTLLCGEKHLTFVCAEDLHSVNLISMTSNCVIGTEYEINFETYELKFKLRVTKFCFVQRQDVALRSFRSALLRLPEFQYTSFNIYIPKLTFKAFSLSSSFLFCNLYHAVL